QKGDVHPQGRLGRGQLLKSQLGQAIEIQMDLADALSDVVRGGDARDLDVRMKQKVPQKLRSAVSGSADHDCFHLGHGVRVTRSLGSGKPTPSGSDDPWTFSRSAAI